MPRFGVRRPSPTLAPPFTPLTSLNLPSLESAGDARRDGSESRGHLSVRFSPTPSHHMHAVTLRLSSHASHPRRLTHPCSPSTPRHIGRVQVKANGKLTSLYLNKLNKGNLEVRFSPTHLNCCTLTTCMP